MLRYDVRPEVSIGAACGQPAAGRSGLSVVKNIIRAEFITFHRSVDRAMWLGLQGHDTVVERFRSTLHNGRLASTYLFVGPPGIGKRRFALNLSSSLLCLAHSDESLDPCGQCESCRLFAAGNHPDLLTVSLPADRASLPIRFFIGEGTDRHREGLCHDLALKPSLADRKIAVIDDADHFNLDSANCLLKTLEEPPAHSLLILIGTSLSRQLPTIRSRSQIIRFRPLPVPVLQQILFDQQIAKDDDQARQLAEASEGSVTRAQELADPELWKFRQWLLARLAEPAWDVAQAEQTVNSFVQEAGKEAAARRGRLRILIGFVLAYYRALVHACAGHQVSQDDPLRPLVQQAEADGTAGPLETRLERLDACLSALEHIDRHANQALVVSHWLHRLARPVGISA